MVIKECIGYELEKEKSNTSEDFFNRSEITYVEDGEEKTLYVLYIRYFDQIFSEFTPYEQDPIFVVDGTEVSFKDIVALVCLLKNPALKARKRVYINSKPEFASIFQDFDYTKLSNILAALKKNGEYQLHSTDEFLVQQEQ